MPRNTFFFLKYFYMCNYHSIDYKTLKIKRSFFDLTSLVSVVCFQELRTAIGKQIHKFDNKKKTFFAVKVLTILKFSKVIFPSWNCWRLWEWWIPSVKDGFNMSLNALITTLPWKDIKIYRNDGWGNGPYQKQL